MYSRLSTKVFLWRSEENKFDAANVDAVRTFIMDFHPKEKIATDI